MHIIDVRTLLVVLVLGNLTSVAVITVYYFFGSGEKSERFPTRYLYAKLFQGMACFLFCLRDQSPDLFSVNLGNIFFLLGFYFEALSLTRFTPGVSPTTPRIITGMFLLAIVVFNSVEPGMKMPNLRIVISSIGIFGIMVIPIIHLLLAKHISLFKRIVSVFYLVFLLLLLPRAVYGFFYDVNIFTNNTAQVLTFMTLVLLVPFSLTTFLLVIKENSDQIIARMATLDLLTRLPNRHTFFEATERHFARHKASGESIAFIFADIDNFKAVNDQHGYAFGDAVLVNLADLLARSIRPGDLSCRYGGEEFLLALMNINPLSTIKVTQRLMEEIRTATIDEQPGFRFTVSIGVYCSIPQEQDRPIDFINQSEAAMCAAKTAGRNRIIMRTPDGDDAFL